VSIQTRVTHVCFTVYQTQITLAVRLCNGLLAVEWQA
jgi:hypothetical protein